jgi:DNA modification methylase
MTVQIIRADARQLPLADSSVDLVVSSPPYWSLRSYQDGGEHFAGQLGSEASPGEFVDSLIEVTRELMRVLKPTGSMWINLGDKYNAYNGGRGEGTIQRNEVRQSAPAGNGLDVKDIRPKSLIGVPWRYALRCIDDLGLILRAEVIWSKPNGLPESVTDRVRRSHETWFHLTLSPRYYSAVDEIREEHAYPNDKGRVVGSKYCDDATASITGGIRVLNPLGKLPGSVWTIPTQPLTVPPELGVDHFAAFPMAFPRRIVTGWSPREVCTACGEGRRPVVVKDAASSQGTTLRAPRGTAAMRGPIIRIEERHQRDVTATVTGYACACPDTTAPATPGTVLDPFGGTGTTALVAHALGRHGISVDMSADYCRLAQWRTSDPKELARAQQREYVPPRVQVDGQDAFDFALDVPQKPPPDRFHRTGWQNGKVDRTPYKCIGCGREKQYADAARPCPNCGEAA